MQIITFQKHCYKQRPFIHNCSNFKQLDEIAKSPTETQMYAKSPPVMVLILFENSCSVHRNQHILLIQVRASTMTKSYYYWFSATDDFDSQSLSIEFPSFVGSQPSDEIPGTLEIMCQLVVDCRSLSICKGSCGPQRKSLFCFVVNLCLDNYGRWTGCCYVTLNLNDIRFHPSVESRIDSKFD